MIVNHADPWFAAGSHDVCSYKPTIPERQLPSLSKTYWRLKGEDTHRWAGKTAKKIPQDHGVLRIRLLFTGLKVKSLASLAKCNKLSIYNVFMLNHSHLKHYKRVALFLKKRVRWFVLCKKLPHATFLRQEGEMVHWYDIRLSHCGPRFESWWGHMKKCSRQYSSSDL